MLRVLKAEVLKLRRSRAAWGTAAIVAMFGLLTIVVARFEDLSVRHATWRETMALAPQFMAAWWGLLVFGMATAALFGSEYADGTAGSMLTAPVRRETFVVAKLVVLAVWVAALSALAVATQMLAAAALGADGFAWTWVWRSLRDSLQVAAMVFMTLPVVALLAVAGRGFLAPMLYSSGLTAVSMTAAWLDWERWVPWAMPLTVAGGIAPPGLIDTGLPAWSYGMLAAMFAVGLAAVFAYVDLADARTS